eukprot:7833134-Ditylum_brightwellii.AAC.1
MINFTQYSSMLVTAHQHTEISQFTVVSGSSCARKWVVCVECPWSRTTLKNEEMHGNIFISTTRRLTRKERRVFPPFTLGSNHHNEIETNAIMNGGGGEEDDSKKHDGINQDSGSTLNWKSLKDSKLHDIGLVLQM